MPRKKSQTNKTTKKSGKENEKKKDEKNVKAKKVETEVKAKAKKVETEIKIDEKEVKQVETEVKTDEKEVKVEEKFEKEARKDETDVKAKAKKVEKEAKKVEKEAKKVETGVKAKKVEKEAEKDETEVKKDEKELKAKRVKRPSINNSTKKIKKGNSANSKKKSVATKKVTKTKIIENKTPDIEKISESSAKPHFETNLSPADQKDCETAILKTKDGQVDFPIKYLGLEFQQKLKDNNQINLELGVRTEQALNFVEMIRKDEYVGDIEDIEDYLKVYKQIKLDDFNLKHKLFRNIFYVTLKKKNGEFVLNALAEDILDISDAEFVVRYQKQFVKAFLDKDIKDNELEYRNKWIKYDLCFDFRDLYRMEKGCPEIKKKMKRYNAVMEISWAALAKTKIDSFVPIMWMGSGNENHVFEKITLLNETVTQIGLYDVDTVDYLKRLVKAGFSDQIRELVVYARDDLTGDFLAHFKKFKKLERLVLIEKSPKKRVSFDMAAIIQFTNTHESLRKLELNGYCIRNRPYKEYILSSNNKYAYLSFSKEQEKTSIGIINKLVKESRRLDEIILEMERGTKCLQPLATVIENGLADVVKLNYEHCLIEKKIEETFRLGAGKIKAAVLYDVDVIGNFYFFGEDKEFGNKIILDHLKEATYDYVLVSDLEIKQETVQFFTSLNHMTSLALQRCKYDGDNFFADITANDFFLRSFNSLEFHEMDISRLRFTDLRHQFHKIVLKSSKFDIPSFMDFLSTQNFEFFTLKIRNTEIGEENLKVILEKDNYSSLELNNVGMNPGFFKKIELKSTKLQTLNLSYNKLNLDDILHISEYKNIRTVYLDNCGITGASLKKITDAFYKNPGFFSIYVRNNGINKSDVVKILKKWKFKFAEPESDKGDCFCVEMMIDGKYVHHDIYY